jgi:tRNA(Leu) C34 or U34 (ribose-2'-O)-methylase TrmL
MEKKFSIRESFGRTGMADRVIAHLKETANITVNKQQVYQAGRPESRSGYKEEILAALEYLQVQIPMEKQARIAKIKNTAISTYDCTEVSVP